MAVKEIYKNPNFYYIITPLVIALWPLYIYSSSLPNAEKNWQKQQAQCEKAQKIVEEIFTLDPERLALAQAKDATAQFDYATAVEKTASLCRIPTADYKLSSGIIITSGGQKSQSARVSLKNVDIEKFAKFLSTIQLRWTNLQCAKLKLTKKKGLPDSWDADLDFKYFF